VIIGIRLIVFANNLTLFLRFMLAPKQGQVHRFSWGGGRAFLCIWRIWSGIHMRWRCGIEARKVQPWSGVGTDLVRTWYGVGAELVRTWYGVGAELVRSWYGVGADLVRTWCGLGTEKVAPF